MTPEEFKSLRQQLGLNQTELAREWGVTDRAVRRWEAGHSPVPPVAAYCLRIMAQAVSFHQAVAKAVEEVS